MSQISFRFGVEPPVLGLIGAQLKIFNRVVKFIFVYMVNNFTLIKKPPKVLLHHSPMNENQFTCLSKAQVSMAPYRMLPVLPVAFDRSDTRALARAIFSFTAGILAVAGKFFSTNKAGFLRKFLGVGRVFSYSRLSPTGLRTKPLGLRRTIRNKGFSTKSTVPHGILLFNVNSYLILWNLLKGEYHVN